MEPTLIEGQVVWVVHWFQPKVGDIVIINFENKDLVKRVVKIQPDCLEVTGDNKNDTLEIGRVARAAVVGKVISGAKLKPN